MAIFRKIHVSFWSDSYTSTLTDKEKLFYLYLLTNERTTQLGVYEITKRQMSFDTGYSIDMVSILLKKLIIDNKIRVNNNTNELAIRNWNKYNFNASKKVQVLLDKEISRIKDKELIQYSYNIDTVSILLPQEEEEEEEEEEYKMKDFNIETCKLDKDSKDFKIYETSYKLFTGYKIFYPDNKNLDKITLKEWIDPIRDLFKDGYNPEQIKTIANYAVKDDFWNETIFNTKSLCKNFETLVHRYKKKEKTHGN